MKLLIADIDGTLVNKDHEMLPLTRQSLEILHQEGVLIGVASGRQIDSKMLSYPKRWGLSFPLDVCIGMNGGQWYVKDEGVIHENFKLSKEVLKKIITSMERFDLNPYMYRGESMICKRIDVMMVDSVRRNRIPSIVVPLEEMYAQESFKVMYKIEEDQMDEVLEFVKTFQDDSFVAIKTQPIMLEFQSANVHKGYALEKVLEALQIDRDDVYCFGDMDNDITMLQASGHSVALCNGSNNVLEVAKEITSYSSEEDGVGHYLFDNVLNNR